MQKADKVNIIEKKDSVYAAKLKFLALKYFVFFPPVFFILILAMGYFLLLEPKYERVRSEIEIAVEKREQERDKYEEYFNRYNQIKQAFIKLPPGEVEKIDHLLPVNPEAEKLMVELESIISRKGLLLSSVKIDFGGESNRPPKEPAENGKAAPKEIYIDLSIAGADYRALKMLLTDLENNLRLLDVKQVNFSPQNDTVNLSLAAYYLGGD